MTRDYVILVDEDGQPYIAHSVVNDNMGVGRGVRRDAKYIEKIKDGLKTRYFYTQEALKAYYDNLRNKAGSAVNKAKETARNAANTVGNSARNMANRASSMATRAANTAKDYSRRTGEMLKRHGSETLSSIRAAGEKVKDKARDVIGYDEYDRYEQAWDRTSNAKDRAVANPNSMYAQREVEKAEANEARAHDEYLRTPLGRAREAASRAKELASTVKDKTLDSIGYDEFERYERARSDTSNAKDRAASKPQSAKAQEEVERAEENEARAHDEYLRTPLGRIRDAGSRVKETASEVKDRAKDMAENVASEMSKVATGAINNTQAVTSSIFGMIKGQFPDLSDKEVEQIVEDVVVNNKRLKE